MTQPDFRYRATVIHYAPTDGPDYLWANVHEFTAPAGLLGDAAASQAIANAFTAFHRAVLQNRYGVDRVVLATWGPDLPFPEGFTSFAYREPGNLPASGAPIPLSLAVFVRKRVQRGRNGKMFLRGAANTALVNGENLQSDGARDLRTIIPQAGATLINALTAQGATLALVSGPLGANARAVTSMDAVDVRTLQYRTRRKTRLQANAIQTLADIVSDGTITLGEVPQVIDALRRLFPGGSWPQLPPPTP